MTDDPKRPGRRIAPEDADAMLMLPWHAAGTLDDSDRQRVEAVLRQYPELAMQADLIREEQAETIHLNESLTVPSSRLNQRLAAAIGAEAGPVRRPAPRVGSNWFTGFLAGLSPRTLAAAASVGCLAIALQSAVIVDMLNAPKAEPQAQPQTQQAPVAYRGLGATEQQSGTFATIRFAPKASIGDVTNFLQNYRAALIEGPNADGVYRLRVAMKVMSKEELSGVLAGMRRERVVESVAAEEPGR